jgi:LEA14-like dessication related protein
MRRIYIIPVLVLVAFFMNSGFFNLDEVAKSVNKEVEKVVAKYKPEVTFKEYKVKSVSFDRIILEFNYIIENKTPIAIKNIKYNYELLIEGQKFTKSYDEKIDINANGKSLFVIPVDLEYVNIFKSVGNLLNIIASGKKAVPFTLITTFKIASVTDFSFPITTKGELPLPEPKVPEIPKIKLPF